jgi:hypothetical protein
MILQPAICGSTAINVRAAAVLQAGRHKSRS